MCLSLGQDAFNSVPPWVHEGIASRHEVGGIALAGTKMTGRAWTWWNRDSLPGGETFCTMRPTRLDHSEQRLFYAAALEFHRVPGIEARHGRHRPGPGRREGGKVVPGQLAGQHGRRVPEPVHIMAGQLQIEVPTTNPGRLARYRQHSCAPWKRYGPHPGIGAGKRTDCWRILFPNCTHIPTIEARNTGLGWSIEKNGQHIE